MKKLFCLIVGLTLLATSLCLTSFAAEDTPVSKWDGTIPEANTAYVFEGKGTKAEPWLIRSAAELAQLAANVRLDSRDTTYGGKFFKLTVDIDLDNHPWMGIGGGKISANDGLSSDGKTGIVYFAGNFDGDWHKIYNLKLATTGTVKNAETGAVETYPVHQQGLFGYILGARISNLGIESGEIVLDGNNRCGALVGVGRCGFLIENCYSKANVTATTSYKAAYIGGFSGQLIDKWDINANTEKQTSGIYKEKKIINCYNMGNVNVTLNQTDGANEFRIGGFAAQFVGGAPELNKVYNIGDVVVVSNSVASSKTNHRVAVSPPHCSTALMRSTCTSAARCPLRQPLQPLIPTLRSTRSASCSATAQTESPMMPIPASMSATRQRKAPLRLWVSAPGTPIRGGISR